MASSTDLEERFNRAVRTIQNLPADGIIKPSNLTKLMFYGLYKQAMMGPCKDSQPYVVNYVARAKWEAWDRCRAMNKEQAMQAYLDEIRKIIESMPQTNEVLEFAQSMGFSNKPTAEASNSENRSQTVVRQDDQRTIHPAEMLPSSTTSSSSSTVSSDIDEYYDDASDLLVPCHSEIMSDDHHRQQAASAADPHLLHRHHSSRAVQRQMPSSTHHSTMNRGRETQRVILIALTKLQRDIHNIAQRLNQLESLTYLLQQKQLIAASQDNSVSWWLPLSNFRRGAVAFILLWPFVAFLLIRLFLRAKVIIRLRGQPL